ncbi:hypothetical protein D3C78_1463160 [compost metagenome]
MRQWNSIYGRYIPIPEVIIHITGDINPLSNKAVVTITITAPKEVNINPLLKAVLFFLIIIPVAAIIKTIIATGISVSVTICGALLNPCSAQNSTMKLSLKSLTMVSRI